jgi:hypothetical protein
MRSGAVPTAPLRPTSRANGFMSNSTAPSRQRWTRNLATRAECPECIDGWIEAPDEWFDGHRYECVQPCPRCELGVKHLSHQQRGLA